MYRLKCMGDTDEELMLAYKNGVARAFNTLLTRHQNGIYNFLYRFLGNPPQVDEAFQEVLMRVIKATPAYTPTAKFSTWLYTIARHYCIDMARKRKSRPHSVSLHDKTSENDEFVWEDKIQDEKQDPASQVTALHLTEKLEEALSRLNQDQREVFLLREVNGLSFEEIATVVKAPLNTVKSRMRYALSFLQKEFQKLGIKGDDL